MRELCQVGEAGQEGLKLSEAEAVIYTSIRWTDEIRSGIPVQ